MFKLCDLADLEDDVPIECDAPDGEVLVVVRHQGAVYAVASECPHQEAPLVDAEVADGKITCCLHFWTWTLKDGQPAEEAEEPLPTYPVVVRDDGVYLQQDEPAR